MQEAKNAIFQMRFPQKLWYLLNLRTDVILWGGTGRTILLNYRILQNYLQCDQSIFKTTNISSFVRQLNLYGFRKVTSHLQDPLCNSSNPYMHEYVHDFFQFGRPELLNKITRKALAIRKSFKPTTTNVMFNNVDSLCLSPLERARRTFRLALKKAAQELYAQSSPKEMYNFESEETQDVFYEDEENVEFDWCALKNMNSQPEQIPQTTDSGEHTIKDIEPEDRNDQFNNSTSQDTLMNFSDDSCQQNNDNFSSQFLSMPDLDPEPTEVHSGVELLAQFDIDNDCDQGIAKKATNEVHNQNMLNCVLPSISNDQNDDVTLAEKHDEVSDHYNGEWDQMFNDMMTSKGNNQECGSDNKDFFSHISKTLDLLNS